MPENAIIIGGGPAGSCSALNLLNTGLTPIVLETERFPRFHIGESLTTECTDALIRLGLKSDIENLKPARKKGVRIFSNHPDNSFYVGAGDAWQVERASFDHMLLNTAKARGAEVINAQAVGLNRTQDQWNVIIKTASGNVKNLNARFVIDASGQKRFSYRQGFTSKLIEGDYSHQIAFFSHYKNVKKMPMDNDDTLIFHRSNHQWCWMIPLSEEITSIGIVTPVSSYKSQKLPADDFIQNTLENFSEPVKARFDQAQRSTAVRTVSNYSYRIDDFAHQGLYCVGDSHRFIDPIFSFGVEFAVLEAQYMSKAVSNCVNKQTSHWQQPEKHYMQVTTNAQNIISDLLSYFWAHPWGFANMAHFRHKEEFLEIFAGRIYEAETGTGLAKMRASMS